MPHTIPATVAVRLTAPTLTADTVLDGLQQPLQATAQAIYRTLHSLGVHVIQARGHSFQASQVVLHQSVELLAAHLGISRVTFYKHLATLHSLGLVHSRGHTSAYGGLARKDGTLFAVSLKPGHRARLRYDDLRHQWRDLAADIASGTRTAWAFLQGLQSKKPKDRVVRLENLEAWAVNPGQTDKKPVQSDCKPQEYVYSLELLADTHPRRRHEAVDRYAQALAAGYGDHSNLNFWRWVLWRAIDSDHRGEGGLYRLQNALTRLAVDIQEWPGLKKPGALLVHRLKECGLYEQFQQPVINK